MRKDNSEFLTGFITESGHFKSNRDYVAYIELDDMACWVLADGLDSGNDTLSSKLVVSSIINYFTENPFVSKKHLKKAIREANDTLINESRLVKLQSTVAVVITDYTHMIWGSLGNTRLYHLRKDKINLKSKDHSLAQLMLEAGEIDERQLNQHKERNNLTDYLGKGNKVKPYISKKIKLNDDDSLFLSTSGFWENISDKEIEDILKSSADPKEFVGNLEDLLFDKANNNLDNYSMLAIFVKKVFKQDVKKKSGISKKIAAVLIPILMMTGGYMAYKRVKQIRVNKMTYRRAIASIKSTKTTSKKQQNLGDNLFKEGKYNEALEKYNETKSSYEKLMENKFLKDDEKRDIEDKIKDLNLKIEDVQTIIASQEIVLKGDEAFNNESYEAALNKYKEAKLNYLKLKVKEYNLNNLEKKIAKTESIIKAVAFEVEGDIFVKSNNLSIAKEKYTAALELYKKNQLSEAEDNINDKMENIKILISQSDKSTTAKFIEEKADQLFRLNEFKDAILKYTEAKVIYSELNKVDKVNEVNQKINRVSIAKEYIDAKYYEERANVNFKEEKYEEGLFNYKQAYNTYSNINKSKDATRVEQKIEHLQKIKQALKMESEGDEFLKVKDFDNSRAKYMEAKLTYLELKETEKAKLMEEKINRVGIEQIYSNAKNYESIADMQVENEKYDKALNAYRQAENLYSRIEKKEDLKRIAEKIENTKEKSKKFLFFF